MANLELKIATTKDLSILNSLYVNMNNSSLLKESKIQELWQKIKQIPEYYIYLAYLNEQAIGTFSLIFFPTIIYPGFHKTAILDVVTVHSDYRGQGWGSIMIKKALEISADAGCYKVTLSSSLHRNRAHKFYQSLGFKQHGFSFSYQLNN